MTKKELIQTWGMDLISDKPEFRNLLDSVIKDELGKFMNFWNSNDSYLITEKHIQSYLNSNK